MTFSCDADRGPLGRPSRGLDEHPGDRAGAVGALEDAHLVVDELEPCQLGVEPLQRQPQRAGPAR